MSCEARRAQKSESALEGAGRASRRERYSRSAILLRQSTRVRSKLFEKKTLFDKNPARRRETLQERPQRRRSSSGLAHCLQRSASGLTRPSQSPHGDAVGTIANTASGRSGRQRWNSLGAACAGRKSAPVEGDHEFFDVLPTDANAILAHRPGEGIVEARTEAGTGKFARIEIAANYTLLLLQGVRRIDLGCRQRRRSRL
jgi:hypothetical protein